jgi:hypothetical protein
MILKQIGKFCLLLKLNLGLDWPSFDSKFLYVFSQGDDFDDCFHECLIYKRNFLAGNDEITGELLSTEIVQATKLLGNDQFH